jgi:hypothetical protein
MVGSLRLGFGFLRVFFSTVTLYQSESDFTLAIPGSAPAGLANFGTRFKAVFRNVPKGCECLFRAPM